MATGRRGAPGVRVLNADAADLVCVTMRAAFVPPRRRFPGSTPPKNGPRSPRPPSSTLKRVEGSRIVSTVDREGVFARRRRRFSGRTCSPARSRGRGAADATDEAVLVEALGVTIAVVPVSRLLKVTTPEDLELALALIEAGRRRAETKAK